MELAAAGKDHKALREIARNLIDVARHPDITALPAIREIADRLDGRPAQEATVVTIDDKRDATDWSRAELVEFLNHARDGSDRAAAAGGGEDQSDSVH